MNGDGYPDNWQSQYPGPWPVGMPIWLDSWGTPPPLVYYGNGTNTPGPMLPLRFIAEATVALNEGRGPALEPIPLSTLMLPPAPTGNTIPTPLRFSDYTKNPPIGAQVATLNSLGLGVGGGLYQTPQQRGIQLYNGSPVNLTGGQIGGIITAAAGLCDGLPPAYKTACQAAAAVGQAVVGGVAGAVTGSVMSSTGTALGTACPSGWTWSSTLGRCVALQNALPGGQPLTLTRNEPTQGGLGMTAVTPTQVGTIQRNDGSTGPILRCPRRYVLGQDYLCYPKSMIPNQLRAHPRGTRPLLTGGEVKIMRKAQSLSKKVGKLGTKFGPKHCHCSKPTRRKK